MTNEERLRAFTLRLEGETWEDIGTALGYRGESVSQDLAACLRRPRLIRSVYPELAMLIRQDYGGCIRDFALACGIRPNLMYDLLSGRKPMTPDREGRIRTATGVKSRELFHRRECHVHL